MRTVLRLVGAFAAIASVIAVHAACGLQVEGAATPEVVDGSTTPPPALTTDTPPPPRPEGDAGLIEGDGGQTMNPCAADQATCNGVCSNLQTDSENCGTCGHACAAGEACEAGNCVILCQNETVRCGAVCTATATDPLNCGQCGKVCDPGTPLCQSGVCVISCTNGTSPCGGGGAGGSGAATCANLTNDPNNCGGCGVKCTANQTCTASACKSLCGPTATIGDVFGANMIGCAGKVSYADRATLCAPGVDVCSASEYVQRRAGKKPTYNYWTSTNLGYYGNSSDCLVDTSQVYSCGSSPMHVCTGSQDALGNRCNWRDCGYKNYSPNAYFGGCSGQGNGTAGTLCCPD